MNLYNVLQEVKEKLDVLNVKSCKIGLERGINAKDCTFIRIVSEKNRQEFNCDSFNITVVYGFNIKNNDLETMYEQMYTLELQIREALEYKLASGDCFFVSTTTDGDMMDNLKSAVSVFRIDNIRLS